MGFPTAAPVPVPPAFVVKPLPATTTKVPSEQSLCSRELSASVQTAHMVPVPSRTHRGAKSTQVLPGTPTVPAILDVVYRGDTHAAAGTDAMITISKADIAIE